MTLLEHRQPTMADAETPAWVDVCALDELIPDRGVAALVDGTPMAIFRCSPDDRLFAIGNVDPFSGTSVMSRGIVGSVGDRSVVVSPLYKQRFDLTTGEALEDASVTLPVHDARCHNGMVQVTTTFRNR